MVPNICLQPMDSEADQPGPSRKRKLDKYRKKFYEERSARHKRLKQLLKKAESGRKEDECRLEITDVIVTADDVDMTKFSGTFIELVWVMESFYANDGRDFNPTIAYSPWMLTKFGKDYALNARGIYYRYWQNFKADSPIPYDRKIWKPSTSVDEKEVPGFEHRAARAQRLVAHAQDNVKWRKSEYSWEADAWSDVFGTLRDSPFLTINKHDYFASIADTDPVSCKLTGESTYVTRTPDATFGLTTFTDSDAASPAWTSDLHDDRLEQLLTHPKYGLYSDPKRDKIEIAFPFMVYEAKGWSGDCRVARRQACTAAAYYLDMLDELVRYPGPVGTSRPYQTKTSHQFQVFALTSFGAYWHLLVGYKRPRSPKEHVGAEGLSDSVYIFHQVWSGYIMRDEDARQLLCLMDQIHVWAITEYRSMILQHLRLWHQHCHENFHLEWKSLYDRGNSIKIRRVSNASGDLTLPNWVDFMSKPSRDSLQNRAKEALSEFLKAQGWDDKITGCDGSNITFTCWVRGCDATFSSWTGTLTHMEKVHNMPEHHSALLRWKRDQALIARRVNARHRRGGTHGGHRGGPEAPIIKSFPPLEDNLKDLILYHRSKEARCSNSVPEQLLELKLDYDDDDAGVAELNE